ncbi:GFA family protein [Alsobacter sp. SYSU M60028]|uniref:GFA family protein n=1 Tax=Alsobacter ponti TaxID=2962936 RepID=A0ABT1LDA6_9HYPH|nr:GFA family protein [Alsobacter ponti]MCP8939414.1 GFA family protein [Alsobacter ponti]
MRIAACSCGQLTAACEGEPVRVSICHCFACQRRTGSVFGVQSRWATKQVTITGEASEFVRRGDSGLDLRFRFCPRCGTTLWWTLERDPGLVVVAVGTFADPDFPPPTVAVYEDHGQAWTPRLTAGA